MAPTPARGGPERFATPLAGPRPLAAPPALGSHEMPDGLPSTTERNAAIAPGEALARALDDPSAAWPDVVLRDHQIEALDELAGRLAHGVTRTWVDAPTGSGKTIMFLALAQALGGSTLVLVPRRNLADQTAAALARHFPSIPTHPEGPESAGRPGVSICTYQAALRHQERMDWDSVTLLICDEAHATLGAQTRACWIGRRTRSRWASRPRAPPPPDTWSRSSGPSRPPWTASPRSSAASSARCARCASSARSTSPTSPRCAATSTRRAWGAPSTGPSGTAPAPRCGWSTSSRCRMAGVAYTATVAQAHALADEMTERGVRAAAVSGQTPARSSSGCCSTSAPSASTCSATPTS